MASSTIVTGSVGNINMRFEMKGMAEAQATPAAIKQNTKPILSSILEELAQRATLSVSSAISQGSAQPPLSFGSLSKYRIGKLPGEVWPAIPSYASARPLRRSGELARAVDYEKMAPLRFVVGVLAGVKGAFSGGQTIPLSWIAALQETGFMRTVPVTLRMRHFLRVLYGQVTGRTSGGHLPHGYTGQTISTWIPARPIWRETFDQIVTWAPDFVSVMFGMRLGLKGG